MASIVGCVAFAVVAYALWNLAGIIKIIHETREERTPVK